MRKTNFEEHFWFFKKTAQETFACAVWNLNK